MHFLVLVAADAENWKSVDLEVEAIMERFISSTNDPEYLEFQDCTKELEEKYQTGSVNGVKTPDSRFVEKQGRYGYYYNPNQICDWYEVGGRWSQLFLVKNSCTEFSCGEFSSSSKEVEASEGYQWVYAARKKEIAWETARKLLPELKDRKYPVISYGFVRDGVWIPASWGQSLTSWGKDVDEWISGLDDDVVLVDVDCHE